ncbi:TRAP transporter substrate-binding protein DctP [Halanaerobiaceae bacterium Z-7014]|uniref:TRAP transporter substrate-binding protein DctP n=1 Tax=Halonatronomonas betaini TaxID=2778430 RepID=A0A931AUV2_9FIRM|nr:TRAP transporter substrate-binding protein DctP [Halonatronomonas betaini]MBF8437094.1 TRAP transporter substrate-binding protein DctP [Halonatronomonas betaini]
MKRKIVFSLVFILTITFIGAASTNILSLNINQEETIWRFSYTDKAGSYMDQYAHKFKNKIEAETKGKVKVELYPASILGTGEDMIEQAQNNVVHFNLVSDKNIASYIPESQIFQLEYLFPDDINKLTDLINSEKFSNLIEESFIEKNIFPLGYFASGWELISANDYINHPDKLKNYNLRVAPNKFNIRNYEEYGANVTAIDSVEAYSGLYFGVFNGQVANLSTIKEMGFYNTQEYLIETKSNPDINILITNPTFYNSLTDDLKDILNNVILEMKDFSKKLQQKHYDDNLRNIKHAKENIKILSLTKEERQLFKRDAQKIWSYYEEIPGDNASELLNYLININ